MHVEAEHVPPVTVGQRVLVKTQGATLSGVVRYVGPTHFGTGQWAGYEVHPGGHGSGCVDGVCYFDGAEGHAVWRRTVSHGSPGRRISVTPPRATPRPQVVEVDVANDVSPWRGAALRQRGWSPPAAVPAGHGPHRPRLLGAAEHPTRLHVVRSVSPQVQGRASPQVQGRASLRLVTSVLKAAKGKPSPSSRPSPSPPRSSCHRSSPSPLPAASTRPAADVPPSPPAEATFSDAWGDQTLFEIPEFSISPASPSGVFPACTAAGPRQPSACSSPGRGPSLRSPAVQGCLSAAPMSPPLSPGGGSCASMACVQTCVTVETEDPRTPSTTSHGSHAPQQRVDGGEAEGAHPAIVDAELEGPALQTVIRHPHTAPIPATPPANPDQAPVEVEVQPLRGLHPARRAAAGHFTYSPPPPCRQVVTLCEMPKRRTNVDASPPRAPRLPHPAGLPLRRKAPEPRPVVEGREGRRPPCGLRAVGVAPSGHRVLAVRKIS
eukprot:TRINITY_DN5382_c0_g1_i2.p1 TRINITY_DN5382_c0_g1~~TRINITY_DN5382_c0_g1_i2.p1  ORF type:complete len:491 (+),score=57.70 TRINITY_DN5382_c0_g1_i2:128-1600(+)